MTENEAIKIAIHCLGVQAEQEVCEECDIYGNCHTDCKDAAVVAIKALKEIQQYREIGTVEACKELASMFTTEKKNVLGQIVDEWKEYIEIGTVEECREAVDNQIPKKPVCKPKPYNKSVGFNEEWVCPSCGAYIGYFYEGMDEPEQMEHCNECGQHIARDWSDENEDE